MSSRWLLIALSAVVSTATAGWAFFAVRASSERRALAELAEARREREAAAPAPPPCGSPDLIATPPRTCRRPL